MKSLADSMHVLGLEDCPDGNQNLVYVEFKEQLVWSPKGWYVADLLWKGSHPPLPHNKHGSLKRLDNLVRKLEKQPGMLPKYDDITLDQYTQAILERALKEPEEKEFYLPQKAVVRETAESTKIRIVYDGPAPSSKSAPSLSECSETGPPSQNKLWSVLARNRFYPVVQASDLKQTFSQVRTRKGDRDTMRFHWLKDLETKQVKPLRFTHALTKFELSTSPFNLGGFIDQHLRNLQQNFPNEVEEVKRSLSVDNPTKNNSNVCRSAISSHNCIIWRVVNSFRVKFAFI